jgi:SPP1 family predicted phage head-tail adaptor
MNAGAMRHQISLLAPSTVSDELGGVSGTTTLWSGWAQVKTLQGRELYNAQQIVAQVTHKIVMRWIPGVQANQTVLFVGPGGVTTTFQVQYVINPDERMRELDLLCIERDTAASDA